MKINCLSVEVYRSSLGDCTNNGISNRFDTILLAHPEGPHSFFSEHETPLNFCAVFERCGHLYVAPAMVDERGQVCKRPGWWMNGGNIASTCDSRFSRICGYAIDIHDRREH